jgi:hypothetical protein
MRNDLAGGDCPDQDNAKNHDAAPAARAQPNPARRESGNAAGTGDILTAEEREAVRVAAAAFRRARNAAAPGRGPGPSGLSPQPT